MCQVSSTEHNKVCAEMFAELGHRDLDLQPSLAAGQGWGCGHVQAKPSRTSWLRKGQADGLRRKLRGVVWPTASGQAIAVAVLPSFVLAVLSEIWPRSFYSLTRSG